MGEGELNALSAAQKSTASSDALGVFLLGLPLGSMSGNDKEALIAVAKGRVPAMALFQAGQLGLRCCNLLIYPHKRAAFV